MANNPAPAEDTTMGTPSSAPTAAPTPSTTPNPLSSKRPFNPTNNASASPAPPSSSVPITSAAFHMDFEALAAKLSDPNGDIKVKIHLTTELREMIDLCQRDVEFTKHLEVIVSTAIEILSNTRPAFITTSGEYKFRHVLLDMLSRIPSHEFMRSHVINLMNLIIELIRTDNEESVIMCLKLAVDLYRTFKPILEPTVRPFLQVVMEMYDQAPANVEEVFGEIKTDPNQPDGIPISPDGDQTPTPDSNKQQPSLLDNNKPSLMRRTTSNSSNLTANVSLLGSESHSTETIRGLKSFKALQECPTAVVFLLQSFKAVVQPHLPAFLLLSFKFLRTSPLPQVTWHGIISDRGQSPFLGVAPTIVRAGKRGPYSDLTIAQLKVMSFIAYVLRAQTSLVQPFASEIPLAMIRLLKDLPPEATTHRRELLVAARHILSSEYRGFFIPYLNEVLNVRIFMGDGISSLDSLRPLVYSLIADLVHHIKSELHGSHILTVLITFIELLNDPTSNTVSQAMVGKLIYSLMEFIGPHRFEPQEAIRIARWLMESFVSKLVALGDIRAHQLKQLAETPKKPPPNSLRAKDEPSNNKGKGKEVNDTTPPVSQSRNILDEGHPTDSDQSPGEAEDVFIERGKILGGMNALLEPSPDHSKDLALARRLITRSCITSFQVVFGNLKKMEAPLPDAKLLGRLWTAGVRCFGIYDNRRELREFKEIVDSFIFIFTQIDLVLFTETIEPNMGLLMNELRSNGELLAFPQYLLANQALSKTFIGIILRYLMDHFTDLGKDKQSMVLVKLFKMCFMSVTLFPENEVVLQPHLSRLIMDSIRLASFSNEPAQHYAVLRGLFRSIGGGRFEVLYKEVLPLLQVLLEELNALLNSTTDPKERDLFAELCLTVPVRLSVLLPYLSYLMRPLVIALQAIPELVSQGLRTLELCVDNLTQEFLNPLMAPVIHEVMASLWKLLKPLPYNTQHAPTTLRILGKLGGRNRRILGPRRIEWKPVDTQACYLPIRLDGQQRNLTIPPLVDLATRMMRRGDIHYRRNGFAFLKNITPLFLSMGYGQGEREETFSLLLKGLFDATRLPEFSADAQAHLSALIEHVFITEIWQEPGLPGLNVDQTRCTLFLTGAIYDALIDNLTVATDRNHFQAASEFTLKAFQNLFRRARTQPLPKEDMLAFTQRIICSKAISACYDNSWHRKCAGHKILSILVNDIEMSSTWIVNYEVDIVRGLLFLHKDAPSAAESLLEGPTNTLLEVLKICHRPSEAPSSPEMTHKLNYLVGCLIVELASQTSGVRKVTKLALQLISERTNKLVYELLLPVRERLSPIFGKPLRALAFPMQIGHLDALTYCARLEPPLFDYSDQLMRILQEALGIADADDVALIGRTNQAKTAKALVELRVVCLRFLAATSKLPEMRQQSITKAKILSVYFQSLYAKNVEVVDAAHASLKELLAAGGSSRLPKDLLQNGLRPVLNNLSDHKKLTLPSLLGLARLVELLTNYFKVEIGSKLLDHFRQLSDPQILTNAALCASQENGVLEIMAGVVNIFHLLACPAAGVYLPDLITYVVHVETILKKVTSSPFTKPLALFINLYPEAAAAYFFQRLDDERHLNTLKWILLSDHAVNFRKHLRDTALTWLQQSYDASVTWGLHGTIVLHQLVIKDPDSIANSKEIVHIIIRRWLSDDRKARLALGISDERLAQLREDTISIEIMMTCVKTNPSEHIDLLFHLADVICGDSLIEFGHIILFYNEHVIRNTDVIYKSAILSRFLDVIQNDDFRPQQKTAILRHFINPLLSLAFERGEKESVIVDAEYINKVYLVIWSAFIPPNSNAKPFTSDDRLNVELLHMATLIVEHRHHLVAEQRKEIIKFGWWFTTLKEDQTVKNAAYILIARFIDCYDSPTKIVSQILLSLLKLHSGEAKHLAQKALDILIPTLPKRYKENPSEWARLTKRTLGEDSPNLAFLFSVYSAIVRNPEPFFLHREMFIPQFAAMIPKLANANGESRALVVDLVELIVRWEQRRIEITNNGGEIAPSNSQVSTAQPQECDPSSSSPSKRIKLDISAPSVGGSEPTPGGYVVPYPIRDAIVSVLVRIIASASDSASKSPLISRTLSLMKLILAEVWPEVEVKLNFFQRAFTNPEIADGNIPVICHTAEVLNVALGNKSDEWLLNNISLVQSFVEKGVSAKQDDLLKIQRPLLNRLFRVFPAVEDKNGKNEEDGDKEKNNTPLVAFEQWTNRIIKEGLKEPRSHENLCSALVLLHAWDQSVPSKVDAFLSDIVRIFTRTMRDHLAVCQAEPGHPTVEQTRLLLESLCNLMKTRVATMGENRLYLLSGLVQLVEKSPSVELCRYILGVQRKWIEDKDPLPTAREKATMLVKMMSYELKGDDDLLNDYLKLILDIYLSSSFSRSEYTVKLEPAFLLGCRSRDPEIRTKFMCVFDDNIRPEPFARLHYLFGVQNWEPLADINWIHHALDLFLGAVEMNDPVLIEGRLRYPLPDQSEFLNWAQSVKTGSVISSARQLLYADPVETEKIWVSLFQAAWSTFSKREQADLTRYLINLFSKEYLMKAVDRRPNVVQVFLSGIRGCNPIIVLPPHLVRYLGKTYAAWYTAIENLQEVLDEVVDFNQDTQVDNVNNHRPSPPDCSREIAGEALAQLYAELGETDIFYGQWRRKSLCIETNAAMSYEQIGEWSVAEQAYELAQEKARANLLPFGQGEYSLWEDHWVLCASKMQQWDFLTDLAKAEHNSELLLECQWRQSDWSTEHETIELAINHLPSNSIRKITFQAYLALLKNHMGLVVDEHRTEMTRLCDEGIQLSLHQWFRLPEIITEAHIPLLQAFQQFVELQEAAQIFASLAATTSQNLETKSTELKNILQTWRERLPNQWDDINIWSDLVAWRQHVFSAINKAYIPLSQANVGANTQTFAYRGHHETAWMVNRFAHVARKHRLSQLCRDSLNRIYTLPNIEISEAFLKLREQAKIHFENPEDRGPGYEIISHTNLMYFGSSQKAEFFTIKAMFLAKLNLHEEASQVFNQAVSTDFQFPKAWAAWGAYQDKLFESSPDNLQFAAGAVNCYLQASGLYKNGKARKLLVRILWLLGLDDAVGTIGRAFDNYKGDIPVWNWSYFVPQLLACLSAPREARYGKALLAKVAKGFPQSLFFFLRTSNDELMPQKQRALNAGYKSGLNMVNNPTPHENNSTQTQSVSADNRSQSGGPPNAQLNPNSNLGTLPNLPSQNNLPAGPFPFEHVDDIIGTLKTQFPLLALSMEMLVDQFYQRFKAQPEEEVYRFIGALLNDALSNYIQRASNADDDLQLSDTMKANLVRCSEHLGRMQLPMQPHFHRDFVESTLNIRTYVNKLQEWRLKYERKIERKIRKSNLENVSHWMIEFQYQKFDDIEIPGQYLKRFSEDNNAHFVRIMRFATTYGYHRQKEHWFRRVTMIGHDASQHSFVIQIPVPRYGRREERIMQFFRMLNCTLSRRRESRIKDVSFTIPAVIPLASNIRIVESDASLCTLQEIFESYCEETGLVRDDPLVAYAERLRSFAFEGGEDVNLIATKLEIADEITTKMIPDCILKNYFFRSMKSAGDLWYFRKRMTIQYSTFIFMTYIFSMSSRTPPRITFDRSSGAVYTTDMFPSVLSTKPEFGHTEAVPFRFTPNIQTFLTRQNIEGLLTASLMAIGHVLVERENELEDYLSIFVRDEVLNWTSLISQTKSSSSSADEFKSNISEMVSKNLDLVVKRARLLACEMERKTIDPSNPQPVCQSLIGLINMASSLPKLYSMDATWMPWL